MNLIKLTSWARWVLGVAAPIALLCALAPLSIVGQSGSGWAHKAGHLAPDEKVSHDYSLMLSPTVSGVQAEEPLRFLSTSLVTKVGEVILQHRHDVKPMATTSSDAVTLRIEDLNLSYVPFYAGQVLGTNPSLAPAAYSDVYVVTVQPVEGKTWGDVAATGDFAIDVRVEPRPR